MGMSASHFVTRSAGLVTVSSVPEMERDAKVTTDHWANIRRIC